MKAVIMAGGEGSRLRPLTCERPKPMVPVLNRPCMEHIVSLLRKCRIHEVAVTLQYLPEEIQNYFGAGEEFGVRFRYFIEEAPLGTAGSVKNAASFLDETFIVISGDALTDCDLQEAMNFHREKGALATLVLTRVACPLEYGVVVTNKEGKITRFLEKPGWGEVFSDTVNTGIYILEPEILEFIEPGKMVDFSKDLYPCLLAAGKPLYAFATRGYWCDVGNIEAYLQAHYDLLEGKTRLPIPATEVAPGVWVEGEAEIDPKAQITPPVYIGERCVIGPAAQIGPLAVLGREVRIGKGASLKRSVVWDCAWLGEGCELRGAVVGTGARVKMGAVLLEGSAVGDRTVVGERSVLKPGVKIWPEKWLEKGTRLRSSLVWGNHARPCVFGSRGISGDLNTEVGPELAARLGAALGSVVSLPARLSLGTDGSPGTQMVKNAVLAGLMSTGVGVVDFGSLTLPVHRYGVRALQLQGGVHICHQGGEKVCLRFLNGQGADYARSEQRKVEGMLSREEYRFVPLARIAPAEYVPDVSRSYLNHLLEYLDRDLCRRARIRIVVDYDPERLGALLPPLLEALGCELVTFAAPRKYPQTFAEMLKTAEQFGDVVKEQRANFGAVLDTGGEELVLVDEKGCIVREDLFTSLISLIVLSGNEQATLALPVTASDAVEEMARRRGGRIRRTKTAPWALMQTFLEEEVRRTQERRPQFLLYGDALATLAVIAEFLAEKRRPLSQILGEIPAFATARRDVEVSWEDKGKVLRTLAEEAGEGEVEMLDGIKMHHPKGWALILPDADEPRCRIYSEAFSQEIADSLTEMYARKIEEICRPPVPDSFPK
ncbi:MAG: NTP transferase domain-containing protein [Firmicutes bacterium]|nr:NTP transferase domain-containing protein [Bacillota bacterium]